MASGTIKQLIKTDSTTITTNTQSGNASPYSYYGSKNIGIKKLIGIWAFDTATAIPVPVAYNPANGYVGVVSRASGTEYTVHYSYME